MQSSKRWCKGSHTPTTCSSPFVDVEPIMVPSHVTSVTCSCLPICCASPPIDWYQIILLGDVGTTAWTISLVVPNWKSNPWHCDHHTDAWRVVSLLCSFYADLLVCAAFDTENKLPSVFWLSVAWRAFSLPMFCNSFLRTKSAVINTLFCPILGNYTCGTHVGLCVYVCIYHFVFHVCNIV